MTDDDVAAQFERLPALVNADMGLVRRGRYLSCDFVVSSGEVEAPRRDDSPPITAIAAAMKEAREQLASQDAAPEAAAPAEAEA